MKHAPALLLLLCVLGCGKTLPFPAIPDHRDLHHRAEYAHGAGAVSYIGRIERNDGCIAFLRELDGYIVLLQDLLYALGETRHLGVPAKAPPSYKEAIDTEVLRLDQEAADVGRLIKEFLDLAVLKKVFEVAPELEEAVRLSSLSPPAPNLPRDELQNHQRILGTGPAACGHDIPDPIRSAHVPDVFIQVRKYDEGAQEVQISAELRNLYARVRSASLAQRKALGLYGPYRAIKPLGQGAGETWTFQVGSVDRRTELGTMGANHHPRALIVECDFDADGNLQAAREQILDESGQAVHLMR